MIGRLFLALYLVTGISSVGVAQTNMLISTRENLSKPDFALPADAPVKILLVRSQIKVAEQSAAGLLLPKADWTLLAQGNLKRALAERLQQQNIGLVDLPQQPVADADFVADYQALLQTVVDTVIKHQLFSTDLLPTKSSHFSWSIGNSGTRLIHQFGADYALFIKSYDAIEAPGRQLATNVAEIMGRPVSAGVHIGYAGLVDLKTGDLVWINANVKMRGDVRDAEGAEKRISQLLEDFPTRAGSATK